MPARSPRTCPCSCSERFSSGIRRTATADYLQTLDNTEITPSARRQRELELPSETPEFQHGAWLPASPHPKYIAHVPSEENRECAGFLSGFSKRFPPAQSCPVNCQESEAIRGAYAFERLRALSASRNLPRRCRPAMHANLKGPCSKRNACAGSHRYPRRARWRDGAGLPRKDGLRREHRSPRRRSPETALA